MAIPILVLLVSTASSWFMTGLIWFVQVVHYPQFADVPMGGFCDYHQRHTRLTTLVVGPPMLLEMASAVWLLFQPPAGLPAWVPGWGIALVAITALSTALLQVPAHQTLSTAFAAAVHRRLCLTNWIRTIAWSARALLMLYAAGVLLDRRAR